jgi:hypothetical protein
VKLDTKCFLCHRVDEDGGHLYFKCKAVKKIWYGLCLEEVRMRVAMVDSAKEEMEEILSMEEQ